MQEGQIIGIDVGAKYEIYELITKLAASGRGVILVSSEMPELLGLCDRIMVLAAGKVTGIVDARSTTKEALGLLMTKNTSMAEDVVISAKKSDKEENCNG